MAENISAEIIAIGTEILLGEITDTNSVFIARTLRDNGINIYYMTSVGDNERRIANIIETALSRADVIITCGGLGPTVDDMTRQAVAIATKRGLSFHQDLLDQISARFVGFKVKMTENNKRQAFLPDDSIVIENPVGTAPSFIVEFNDKVVISLPGVPREMKFLMTHNVVPYLRQKYQLGTIKARVLQTAGIGESLLDDLIGKELLEGNNPTVGLAAHQGCVDVRITAKADNEMMADQMIADAEQQLRERIGQYVFGVDGDKLENVVAALLTDNQIRVAVIEAGIQDTLAKRLSEATNSTNIIAQAKHYGHPDEVRQVNPSLAYLSLRDLAIAVAEMICKEANAQAGIAILSHPDAGENADNEHSTAIAVYTSDITRSRVYGFGSKSDFAQSWVTTWSMAVVWQLLKEKIRPNPSSH